EDGTGRTVVGDRGLRSRGQQQEHDPGSGGPEAGGVPNPGLPRLDLAADGGILSQVGGEAAQHRRQFAAPAPPRHPDRLEDGLGAGPAGPAASGQPPRHPPPGRPPGQRMTSIGARSAAAPVARARTTAGTRASVSAATTAPRTTEPTSRAEAETVPRPAWFIR